MLFYGTKKVCDETGYYYGFFTFSGLEEKRTPTFKIEKELDDFVRNNYGGPENI